MSPGRRGRGWCRVGLALGTGVLVSLVLLPTAAPAQDDVAAIRALFESYKQALLAGDGALAVSLVDRHTVEYWSEIRELALEGTEEDVRGRSFIERLLIVSIRHEIGAERLREMGLAELIEVAFASGWISPASIAQLAMGEVTVEGDEARGQALTLAAAQSQTASPVEQLEYEFRREGGEWKFGFASLVLSLDRVVSQLTSQLGTDENDLIFMLVEGFSGRPVLPEVWERPGAESGEEVSGSPSEDGPDDEPPAAADPPDAEPPGAGSPDAEPPLEERRSREVRRG